MTVAHRRRSVVVSTRDRQHVAMLQQRRKEMRNVLEAIRSMTKMIAQQRINLEKTPFSLIDKYPLLKKKLEEHSEEYINATAMKVYSGHIQFIDATGPNRKTFGLMRKKDIALQTTDVGKAIVATIEMLRNDIKKDAKDGKAAEEVAKKEGSRINDAATHLKMILGSEFQVLSSVPKNKITIRKRDGKTGYHLYACTPENGMANGNQDGKPENGDSSRMPENIQDGKPDSEEISKMIKDLTL